MSNLIANLGQGSDISGTVTETFRGSQVFVRYRPDISDYTELIQDMLDAYSRVVIGTSPSEEFIISTPLYLNDYQDLVVNGTLKMADGTTVNVTSDIAPGDTTVVVDDVSDFKVGQWIAVTDDDQVFAYATYRGWCGKITDITGLTITLDNQCGLTIEVADNAIAAHANSNVLIYEKTNVKISGIGIVDNNKAGQEQIHPTYGIGISEQQSAMCCISIYKSEYVHIDGVETKNGLLHNIALTGLAVGDNKYISLTNLRSLDGHDKNILIRLSDYVFIENIFTDGAIWEDGLIFYSGVRYVDANNIISINNKRYGICWNSNVNEHCNISNIFTSDNYEYGVALHSKLANISNVLSKDPMSINAAYTNENNNMTNITLKDVDAAAYAGTDILRLRGAVTRFNITNLILDGCTGNGIVSEAIGADFPIKARISSGGIYNHTGAKTDIAVGSDVTFTNFDT